MRRAQADTGDKVIARMYNEEKEKLLAACDENLLGETLESGGLCLKVSEIFYGKETVTREQLESMMDECTIANLVGDEVVAVAMEKNLVRKDSILRIAGIPHAQFARMPKKLTL